MESKGMAYIPRLLLPAGAGITGPTVLSAEEFLTCKALVPPGGWYWLRSHGDAARTCRAGMANPQGEIYDALVMCAYGARPAAFAPGFAELGISPGGRVLMKGRIWTAVARDVLLCDGPIGNCPFRADWTAPDSGEWEASDLKAYIEEWWARTPDDAPESCTSRES